MYYCHSPEILGHRLVRRCRQCPDGETVDWTNLANRRRHSAGSEFSSRLLTAVRSASSSGSQATRRTKRFPQALTYRRSVAIDGECLPVAKDRSRRATAGAWVPIRSATCACVRPAFCRAFSSASSSVASSRSMRSTSARTPGRRISFLTSWSCVCTFYLLHSRHRDLAFARWRARALLDEAVQHDDSPSNKRAEENSRNSVDCLQPQFEEPIAKSLRMGFSEIRTKSDHSTCQHDVPRSETVRQLQNLLLNRLAVIGDRVIHTETITNMLSARKDCLRTLSADS